MNIFNICHRKVGGIHFLKLGRLNFAFSVSRKYRPIGERERYHAPATSQFRMSHDHVLVLGYKSETPWGE